MEIVAIGEIVLPGDGRQRRQRRGGDERRPMDDIRQPCHRQTSQPGRAADHERKNQQRRANVLRPRGETAGGDPDQRRRQAKNQRL